MLDFSTQFHFLLRSFVARKSETLIVYHIYIPCAAHIVPPGMNKEM